MLIHSPVDLPRRSARPPARRVVSLVAAVAFAACGRSEDEEFLSHVRFLKEGGHVHHPGDEKDGSVGENVEPLEEVEWVAAADARHMRPGDPVIAYTDGARHWAIPWWIQDNHHVANLVLNEKPVMIVLCERCSSAAAFDPVVPAGGGRLHFRMRGFFNGTILLGDVETGTLWPAFTGDARHGKLKGTQLTRRQLDQATWADWVELHPDTLVAFADQKLREGHGAEDAPGVAILDSGMRNSILHPDDRLPMNALVLGVVVGGEARAYPIETLTKIGTAVDDTLGGKEIVVLHKPGTWLAAAFARESGGQRHAFVAGEGGAIHDVATKSRWNTAGIAKEGSLAGVALEPLHYTLEEWYEFATQYPGCSIHLARP